MGILFLFSCPFAQYIILFPNRLWILCASEMTWKDLDHNIIVIYSPIQTYLHFITILYAILLDFEMFYAHLTTFTVSNNLCIHNAKLFQGFWWFANTPICQNALVLCLLPKLKTIYECFSFNFTSTLLLFDKEKIRVSVGESQITYYTVRFLPNLESL